MCYCQATAPREGECHVERRAVEAEPAQKSLPSCLHWIASSSQKPPSLSQVPARSRLRALCFTWSTSQLVRAKHSWLDAPFPGMSLSGCTRHEERKSACLDHYISRAGLSAWHTVGFPDTIVERMKNGSELWPYLWRASVGLRYFINLMSLGFLTCNKKEESSMTQVCEDLAENTVRKAPCQWSSSRPIFITEYFHCCRNLSWVLSQEHMLNPELMPNVKCAAQFPRWPCVSSWGDWC